MIVKLDSISPIFGMKPSPKIFELPPASIPKHTPFFSIRDPSETPKPHGSLTRMGVELVDDAIGLGSYPVLSGGFQHICLVTPKPTIYRLGVAPSHDAIVANKGLVRDSLLKMVHNPGGHCYWEEGHTQFIGHQTAIWKGSENNPILRGRKLIMAINH